MKRLEREKTVVPFSGSTNQRINEVGVVSKQLKEHRLYYIKVIGNHWKKLRRCNALPSDVCKLSLLTAK